MTKTKQDEIALIAQHVRGELDANAKDVAARLFPVTPPGMAKMSKPDYINFVRRQWPDPQFRQGLLRRVGPKNFMATAKEVLKPQPLEPEPYDLEVTLGPE